MPRSPLFWLALAAALVWLASSVEMGLGTRRILSLRDLPPLPDPGAPRVSVVIAARDEAAKLEPALRSVLALRYPRLEVVVVDDRSTDGTGPLLDRLAAADPRLRVVHLAELPAGWLGKNHAMARGAAAAGGEWILFTDADVVFEPTALSRALGYAVRERLDHLAIAPELRMPGAVLEAFAGAFGVHFARYTRPWRARDPRSRSHIGVGAFNLVRAEAYRAVGGHAPLAMRPDDDVKLGKVLKRAGYRQDLLFAPGMVSVEWYSSVGELVRGLEKNAFAGLDYSVPAVVASCLLLLALDVFPFAALALTDGATRLLYGASAAMAVATHAGSAYRSGSNPAYGLAFPLATLLFVYIVARATVLALRRDGIVWRDTHYPLAELRANRV